MMKITEFIIYIFQVSSCINTMCTAFLSALRRNGEIKMMVRVGLNEIYNSLYIQYLCSSNRFKDLAHRMHD